MGLNLLERYIFRKAALALLVTLAALIGVIWVIRAVQEVDVILNKGQGILTYLQITTLGVPSIAAAVASLALLIALLHVIGTLNNDSELVVMHASGASRMSLLKPFLAISLVTMLVVYALALYVGPISMTKLRGFITQVRADLVSVIVREGVFQSVGDGLTFHIAGRAPGGILKGVYILDTRDEDETLTYLAQEGAVTKIGERSFLVLKSGEIHRLTHKSRDLSVIRYDSYAFNLSTFSGRPGRSGRSQSEMSTLNLLFPDKSGSFYRNYPERIRSEIHKRFTSGLYPLVVCLLVLIFVGNPNSNRQGQVIAVTTVSALVIGLRGLSIVAEGALRSTPNAIPVVWGIPLITIAVAIYFLMTDTSPLPKQMQARIENMLQRNWEKVKKASRQLRGRNHRASTDGAA